MENFLVRRFPALAAREFRLFFLGQFISQTGTWVQSIALSWLVYRLTDSPFWLGLAGLANQAPILLFSALSGVLNDRLDRRRVLLATQMAAMLQALLLAAIVVSGLATPALLITLTFLLGLIHAVDLPARQAFLSQLIQDKARLASAIGLNSFLMNATRLLGPMLAGLVVTHFGEVACFLLNALSYPAVIFALSSLHMPLQQPRIPERFLPALWAGLSYVRHTPRIRTTLLLVASFSFFITPYATLMPVFARDEFAGDATLYGALLSSAGFGSLTAALVIAGSARPDRLLARVVRAARLASLLLAAFALNHFPVLAYPLLAGLGFCVILAIAGANTLIQVILADQFRARVMALFSMAFLGIGPLGGLLAGYAAEHFGARHVLAVYAFLALGLTHHLGNRLKKTGAPLGAPPLNPT
ncbi:MAG: MFS transporter [Rhodocyclaceae bacterium]|nr:MFS transporter [Rhodocyclaceae bacterium]